MAEYRFWDNVPFERSGKTVTFKTDFLDISFTGVGIEGSCPAEKDNEGCYFLGQACEIRPFEPVSAKKEFCDCKFAWNFGQNDAHGVSLGKTLPAVPTEVQNVYIN